MGIGRRGASSLVDAHDGGDYYSLCEARVLPDMGTPGQGEGGDVR